MDESCYDGGYSSSRVCGWIGKPSLGGPGVGGVFSPALSWLGVWQFYFPWYILFLLFFLCLVCGLFACTCVYRDLEEERFSEPEEKRGYIFPPLFVLKRVNEEGVMITTK